VVVYRRRMMVKRRRWVWFLIAVSCVACTSTSVAGESSSTTALITVGSSTMLPSPSTTSTYVDPLNVSAPVSGDSLWPGGPTAEVLDLDGAAFEIPAYQSFEFCGDRPRPGHLSAFSKNDGTERWSVEVPWPAWSEARLVGDKVMVLVEAGWGIAGSALAMDTDGRSAWQTRLSWSPIGSPLMFQDLIVFAVRSSTGGAGVVALDSTDGSVAWGTPLDTVPLVDVSSGLVAVDRFAVITDRRSQLSAIDMSTGRVAWQRSLGGLVDEPALSDGVHVYAVAGEVLYSVDGSNGEIRWRVESSPDVQVNSVIGVTDQTVVVVAHNADTLPVSESFLIAGFDKDHGDLLWMAESSDWVATGPDIVLTDQPREGDDVNPVQAWNPTTGRQIWSVGFEASLRLTAIDMDFVYLPGHSSIAQMRKQDGQRTWEAPLSGLATAPPLPNSDSIYVAWLGTGGSTQIARIEQSNGDVTWTGDLIDPARGVPIATTEAIIVLTASTLAHCA
jgi:outer membrane protein assembly factor BamB